MTRMRLFILALLGACSAPAAPAPAEFDPDQSFWALPLAGFFPGTTKDGKAKPLNLYLVRRQGVWTAGLATATLQGRAVWNTALMPVDASGLRLENGRLSGTARVTLVPDPWHPADQQTRIATVTLDGVLKPPPTAGEPPHAEGSWRADIPGDPAALEKAGLAPQTSGTFRAGLSAAPVPDPVEASYDLLLYDFLPGTAPEPYHRRRALSIGLKNGAAVSARTSPVDIRHRAYDYELLPDAGAFTATADTFSGNLTFSGETLDGEPRTFALKLAGQRVADWVAGTWTDGARQGWFRGNVGKTAHVPGPEAADTRPWFVPVPGHQPVQPGEHPRLFFRKADLPELRRRAATPEGQAILRRLRQQLNGSDGETLPSSFNPATKAYEDNKFKPVPGSYSISHATGYGFLYQLTGDTKYAALARECLDLAFAGRRNFDDRYAWVAPGGELRAGPVLGWTAAAYDLCYEAWPEEYRRKVALALQNYADTKGGEWNEPESITLRKMVLTPRQGPASNHFGAVVGGCGLAVLALLGDPGTDTALLQSYLDKLETQVVRHLSAGWGDGGYYAEGWGASRVGTQGAFLPFLQSLRTARGRDYLNGPRPNASFITLVPRSFLVLGPPGFFPYRSNMGPTYGSPEIGSMKERSGFSHGGYFSEGFGAVADRHKPALLWTWNRIFADDPFDLASPYPHRAMLALLNWPSFSGIQEKNPAEVLPLTLRDRRYDHFAFRNRFQDTGDILTTVLIRQPDGTRPRDVMVWGLDGLRLAFGEPPRGVAVTHYAAGRDGSAVLSAGTWALTVDYSRASGADALLVSTGVPVKPLPATPRARLVESGPFHILTLSASGTHPEAKVEGNRLTIGSQTIHLDDGRLQPARFDPAP